VNIRAGKSDGVDGAAAGDADAETVPIETVPHGDVIAGESGKRVIHIGETAASVDDSARPRRQRADAVIKSNSHARPIGAIPMRDVEDTKRADAGECSTDIHIAALASDGENAVGGAGAADRAAADRVPIGAVPTRDALGQSFARSRQKA